jgi:TM2 domain-containing membrane protein YozV
MKKLGRFIILSILFVLVFLLIYSFVPAIVWLLGGSFKAVAQSVPYVIMSLFTILPFQSFLFSECFDENFYEKR